MINFRASQILGVVLFATISIGTVSIPTPSDRAYAQAGTASYCSDYARRASYYYSRGGAVGGAIRGGTGGAIVGGIVNGRTGARRGATIGAVSGGVARGVQRGVSYDTAYRECMSGRIRY